MSASQSVAPQTPSPGRVTPTTAYSGTTSGNGNMASNGLGSADSAYAGDAASSKIEPGANPTAHAIKLTSYIFNVGYLSQNWADVRLAFFGEAIQLHRIILSRCPYLTQFIIDSPVGSTIRLSFKDENITKDGVHICIQHLYNPAQHLVNPSNARSVLATATLFDGMPELAEHAYDILRDSLSSENVIQYIQWLITSPREGYGVFGAVAAPTESSWDERGLRYGEWTGRLKRDVTDFLIRAYPDHLSETSQSLSTDQRFLSLYSALPFDLLKFCIESPDLPVPSKQDRFVFAKKVIAQRKKAMAATGMEEIAVLAFKGGVSGMEVHVTRKPKKKTALYKVEG